MRGSPASPDRLALEGKAKEEFLNSARRGHEDDGGEGSVSQRKGDTPEGWRFFTIPLWTRLSLSLANFRRKWKLSLLVLWSIVIFQSVVNQIPCDQGGMPKHVMDVWEEKTYTKLEVLSFEKAWDEIERDRFTIGNFRNGTNVEKFINRHILVASKASYWLNVEIPNKKSVLVVLEFFW